MNLADFKAGDVVVLLADQKRGEPVKGLDGYPSGHSAGDVAHKVREWLVLYVKDGSARLSRDGGKHECSADLEALAYPPQKNPAPEAA